MEVMSAGVVLGRRVSVAGDAQLVALCFQTRCVRIMAIGTANSLVVHLALDV